MGKLGIIMEVNRQITPATAPINIPSSPLSQLNHTTKSNDIRELCLARIGAIGAHRSPENLKALQKISDPEEPKGGTSAPSLNGKDGKLITYEHKGVGNQSWEERVERQDAVETHRAIVDKTKAAMKGAPPTEDPFVSDQQLARFAVCVHEGRNCDSANKRGFFTSNYVRDVLKRDLQTPFADAIGQACLGAPINFRYHTSEAGGAHFRLGAFSYAANNHTNLQELQDLRHNDTKRREKIDSLEAQCNQLKTDPVKNARKIESLQYAIAELQNINIAISKRDLVLRMQFLHLLQAQIQKNPGKIQDGTFELAHVAFLNRNKKEFADSGWGHFEENQMRDMQQIFHDLNLTTAIIDRNGPFIDANCKLHVCPPAGQDHLKDGEEFTLNTHFLNVSVQGNVRNDGCQAVINEDALIRLIAMVEKRPFTEDNDAALMLLLGIQRELRAGRSNYSLAEDLGVAMAKLGIPFSIGCLSAKDRTGMVSARIILRHIFEEMDKEVSGGKADAKETEKRKQKMAKDIFNKLGCAAGVVFDNTGHRVLKCSPFHLPGYSENFRDAPGRIEYYLKQIIALQTIATPAAT